MCPPRRKLVCVFLLFSAETSGHWRREPRESRNGLAARNTLDKARKAGARQSKRKDKASLYATDRLLRIKGALRCAPLPERPPINTER